MPRYELSVDETIRVLAGEKVVRVAFHDGGALYLIPLGYVWLDSALFAVAEPGRKARMAKSNPTVAFQVDTSAETGVFEWWQREQSPRMAAESLLYWKVNPIRLSGCRYASAVE
ncbi:MAG: pyridoxamine 5'-phosphate oxidase family protein [Gemmatimonadota bacterium]